MCNRNFRNLRAYIPSELIVAKTLPVLLFLLCELPMHAQNNRQKIRGLISDRLSQITLPGASIRLLHQSPEKASVSDENGCFELSDVAPGRYEIKISFTGYKDVLLPGIVVIAGKELILDITMEEDLKQLDEVLISGSRKDKTINNLAGISARTFSMDEVNRYAGGRSDAARLVANFAGVSAPDDSRNDIVIRGNSPVGVLWRINGMNVVNPNHFASIGTTGGAVSALNTNLLKSSDFLTSAFPAEYGNATAGVFDLGFRNGNSQKRETTVQAGLITGLELTTEGPFSRKNNSSYLLGYRYSLAGVAQAAGVDIGTTALPSYQDLSFQLNSGDSKLGRLTLFGIMASSSISIAGGIKGSLYGGGDGHDLYNEIGIAGLKHHYQFNGKSSLSTTIGLNHSRYNQTDYGFDRESREDFTRQINKVARTGYNIASNFQSKISSRLFLKTGVQNELIGLNLFYKEKRDIRSDWNQVWDYDSHTNLSQAYLHAQYYFSDQLVLNAGIYSQFLQLNNSFAAEPRLSLKYDLNEKSNLSFGYGLHSQMQPLNVYFLQTQQSDGSYKYNNKNLDFTRSQHLVLGYNLLPIDHWRMKTEIYYQHLFKVPVNSYSSSYSMLNTGATFRTDLSDSLVSKGSGQNFGIEFTLERFFSKDFYGLFTSSIYSSKYRGSDGIERNTAFNGKYVYNILFGKEWKTGREKQNKFSIDIKLTNAGGRAYTAIDLQVSQAANRQVLSGDVFASNYAAYLRLDFKVGFTRNSLSRKISQSVFFDLQNVTNNKNVFSQEYDDRSSAIKTTYQLGIFPNFVYKLQF